MEMSPDTLKAVGVNGLFVVVVVDTSVTTEQTASGSLGTHRTISSPVYWEKVHGRSTGFPWTLTDDETLSLHHVLLFVANSHESLKCVPSS